MVKANPDLVQPDLAQLEEEQVQRWTVPIRAKGKERPRVTQNGTYMPPDYERWRAEFAAGSPQLRVKPPYGLEITIVRKIPAGGKNKAKKPGDWCDAPPDGDNVQGAVMDTLMKSQDAAVVVGSWRKVWGREDEIIVEVWHQD
jgi:Holliday junction resolvase RusA-like endonuclease